MLTGQVDAIFGPLLAFHRSSLPDGDEVVIVMANGAATDARDLEQQYLKVLNANSRG